MEHTRFFAGAAADGAAPSVATQCEECFLCGSNDIAVRGPDEGLQLEFASNSRSKICGQQQAVVRIVECHDCGAAYALDTP